MVMDQLARLGITGIRNQNGEQRTLCPQCSHMRRKKRDRCLSVLIDADGFRYNCWHCGFHGGEFEDLGQRSRVGSKAQTQRGDFGAASRRIRYGVVS